ncbi:hypothetical protein BpHYR1_042565 [Brachionus plicatilis]|uniref:Uncharacterized protein n=1 Tax=Brachionus plicatilis TaxID=10195 RepID=A0A3M7SBB1_BRAPC|nr:hypothetical protein BpHYR1_042565 [Brachionus plicatilis]
MVKQKENEREPVRRSTRLTTKNNLALKSSDVEEFSDIEYDYPYPEDSQSNSSFKLIKERLIDHLTKLALNGVFEGKIESKTKLKLSEKKNVHFKCRLCYPSLRKHNSAYITNRKLGKPGNLLKHLRTHKSDIGVWLNEFDNNNSNNYLKKKN